MYENLDHIIWACDDLDAGMREFCARTGVRPRFGGVHASGVTQNALVRIGPRCYLEILAPTGVPSSADDEWSRVARAAHEPRIMTYCMRSPRPLSELAAAARSRGLKDASVADNGRRTPEGAELKWQWTAPKLEELGAAFPFFIDWLDSPHPAATLGEPPAHESVRLREFTVLHPQAQRLRAILSELGVAIEASASDRPGFRLVLETPRGILSL